MARARPRILTAVLAAALATLSGAACDNIEWGGGEVVVVPPQPAAPAQEEEPAADDDGVPRGPVLYHVRPETDSAVMTPVGVISGDTLAPFPAGDAGERYARAFIAERLRAGAEFALFREGRRVGTLAVRSSRMPSAADCPRMPRAYGVPELIPGAADAPAFLALPKTYAGGVPPPRFAPLEANRNMRVVAPILAERLLRARNAPLPGSWQAAMAQLQPFPADDDGAGFTATFLVGDTLGPGLDDEGHALFYIASPGPEGFDTIHAELRDYETAGKTAPRVVDFLDWDDDGELEFVLETYGTADRWFEAVGRVDGEWTRIFDGRCARMPEMAAEADPEPPADTATERTDVVAPVRRTVQPPPATVAEPVFPEPRIELSVPADTAGAVTS